MKRSQSEDIITNMWFVAFVLSPAGTFQQFMCAVMAIGQLVCLALAKRAEALKDEAKRLRAEAAGGAS